MPPVLICNVSWMKYYQGTSLDDKAVGGGKYVDEHGWGHEAFNFRQIDGRCYGYVQVNSKGGGPASLARLGGKRTDEQVSGVTVVWTATHPDSGGRVVVGWYRDATIYANRQSFPKAQGRELPDGSVATYVVDALARNTHLITPENRTYIVREALGGLGRHARYTDDDPALAARLLAYIDTEDARVARPANLRRPGRILDIDRRRAIEQRAVDITTEHFERNDFRVITVERDAVGWDLEARRGSEYLKVEVKGTIAPVDGFIVELTPNEYAQLTSDEHRPDYRLAVVTDCEGERPVLTVYAWDSGESLWLSADATRALEIAPSIAARITGTALT